MKCIIPDTSVIIIGAVSKVITEEKLEFPEVIVPEAVVSELEHQANNNRTEGKEGLNELQKLQEMQNEGKLAITFKGRRPNNYEIEHAKSGEIDSIIRDLARSEMGTLLTNDKVQAETAKAQGIPVYYYEQTADDTPLSIEELFDEKTMSVHLKENVIAMAKKGTPGNVKYTKESKERYTREKLEEIRDEIIKKTKSDKQTFLEDRKDGSLVIQSKEYRISIAYPPFAEAMEITIVKPIKTIELNEYNLNDRLLERIRNNAEGILIAGSPGAGKSTFVQAIAKYYAHDMKKVVKTMESPRDLQLPEDITQYSPLEGKMENTADVLLLVRPDYTIYDELRKNEDFEIFADMRLAGVGMIGVVHATHPIDAIQRIASRVELGTIPSIVDTSIYIEDGEVKKVYETRMTVKVPSGMKEADYARPVIEVIDFDTGELKNEIYTFGEQTIIMDIDLVNESAKNQYFKTSTDKIAEKEIYKYIKTLLPKKTNIKVQIVSPHKANVYLPKNLIPKLIGRNGRRIAQIEEKLGIRLGMESIDGETTEKVVFDVSIKQTDRHLILEFGKENGKSNYNIFINNDYLFSATTSKKGEIKIKQGIDFSDALLKAIEDGDAITAVKDME